MNQSKTPRTDDATLRAIDIEGGGEFQAVHIQVSKRLERELIAVTEQRDEALEKAATMVLAGDYNDLFIAKVTGNFAARAEITTVTAQRDRLAEALWNMLNQEHGSAVKAGILLRSLNLQYLNPNTPNQERKSPASDGSI